MKRALQKSIPVFRSKSNKHGFSLLEVVVALAILAVSLSALLQTQASSIDTVGRARDLTIASLLARSKLIDIEQYLMDEGFKVGTETDKGDFRDEEQPLYKWEYEIHEIELDLLNLAESMGTLMGDFESEEAEDMEDSAQSMFNDALAMAGPLVEPILEDISRSFRLIYLRIYWPAGRYIRQAIFTRLVTKRDFQVISEGEQLESVDTGSNNESQKTSSQGNSLK